MGRRIGAYGRRLTRKPRHRISHQKPHYAPPTMGNTQLAYDAAFMNYAAILLQLQQSIPSLSALYVFGSQASGHAGPDSDLDLAVLADERIGAEKLWDLAAQLARIANCPVDLLDLRAASTVMQYRIITTGKRLWAKDSQAAVYESFILSAKTALDEARSGLLQDIQKTGTVYGR